MFKRALIGVLVLLLLLTAALAVNTLRQSSQQVQLPALPVLTVDKTGAAESLAEAVRARTVSGLLDPSAQAAAFDSLHAHLRSRYPLVHSRLERELVGGQTLVYKWPGNDLAAKPIAWLAHQDVVPIAPGTESLWQAAPFAGSVRDGYIWGRGTWDNKGNLIAQLEAVELQLKAGFQPKRTLYLVFGHDEELGGRNGALAVVELFKQRGVKLDYVIDEGLVVTEGIVPGIAAPVALIGVAEKGYATLQLIARAAPGHSSMPPAPGQSAIGMLSAALTRLDHQPMPGGIRGVAAQMLEVLTSEMSVLQRLALSNLWLFRPLAESMLARGPSTNALMRTTTAMTLLGSGIKDNVMPGRAEASVNFRLLPGDTLEMVVAHVKHAVADGRIEIKPLPNAMPASRVSTIDSDAYRHIVRSLREVFPGVLVAPGLMLGGTDARHFEAVADHVYRFSPVRARAQDLNRLHGNDERLSIDNLAEMVRFYHRLLQRSAS